MSAQHKTVNSQADLQRMEEARTWLRKGICTKATVKALIENIAKVRGQDAADALRKEMLHQWNTRVFWWGEGCPK